MQSKKTEATIVIKFASNSFTVWKEVKKVKGVSKSSNTKIKDTTDYKIINLNKDKAFIVTDRVTKKVDTVFYNISNDTLYTKTYKLNNGVKVVNREEKFYRKRKR